jgi:hypothetical protein
MADVLDQETVELDAELNVFAACLRRYLLAVAGTLGLDARACAINPRRPARGYLAVNIALARFSGRDLALSWDERYGWSAIVESDFGQHVTTIARLKGDTMPDPAAVQAFVDDLVAESRKRPVLRRLRGRSAA